MWQASITSRLLIWYIVDINKKLVCTHLLRFFAHMIISLNNGKDENGDKSKNKKKRKGNVNGFYLMGLVVTKGSQHNDMRSKPLAADICMGKRAEDETKKVLWTLIWMHGFSGMGACRLSMWCDFQRTFYKAFRKPPGKQLTACVIDVNDKIVQLGWYIIPIRVVIM